MSLILLNSEFETAGCAQYSWNILEDVGKSTEYSWDILEYVERALGYSWSFKAWVEQALGYSWNISTWIKKQLGYSWNIFATAITSETFIKYEFSSAKRPKAFYIDILNKVIGLRAPIICYCRRMLSYSWDIPGIEKALSYSWNLLNIEKALSYSWFIGDCCEGVSIGYTTQQMSVDNQQVLNVENPIAGCPYWWEIISGGGSLSQVYGLNTIYTAPSLNGECVLNPVITLNIGESVCDSLAIAVNAFLDNNTAYSTKEPYSCDGPFANGPYQCYRCQTIINAYRCDGTQPSSHSSCVDFLAGIAPGGAGQVCCDSGAGEICNNCAECYECTESAVCPIAAVGVVTDVRTTAMKAAGCCPAQLL